MKIEQDTLRFLSQLAQHNNRDWFTANKSTYEKALGNVTDFADELLKLLQQHDSIETPSGKKSLMRIYRDTRFSKDKTPYRTHFGGGFRRATALRRGGLYFQIGPGCSEVGGGFYSPNPEDLARIREDIDFNHGEWRDLLDEKSFKSYYGTMLGEQLKSAPKGFDKDHPGVDLLRHKAFYFSHSFTDDEVCQADFAQKVNEGFKTLRPWLDYMSEVLTTDSNGESIL